MLIGLVFAMVPRRTPSRSAVDHRGAGAAGVGCAVQPGGLAASGWHRLRRLRARRRHCRGVGHRGRAPWTRPTWRRDVSRRLRPRGGRQCRLDRRSDRRPAVLPADRHVGGCPAAPRAGCRGLRRVDGLHGGSAARRRRQHPCHGLYRAGSLRRAGVGVHRLHRRRDVAGHPSVSARGDRGQRSARSAGQRAHRSAGRADDARPADRSLQPPPPRGRAAPDAHRSHPHRWMPVSCGDRRGQLQGHQRRVRTQRRRRGVVPSCEVSGGTASEPAT